jgi:hypothetical protein
MKRRLTAVLLALTAILLLAGGVLAMSSANYRLDWFTPLTTGGGGPATSSGYAVNFTVGQSVIGSASSANYAAGLGYWYGATPRFPVYLPLALRSSGG